MRDCRCTRTQDQSRESDRVIATPLDRALARALCRRYQVLTRISRLRVIAADIVSHFHGRGFVGKAMVVSLDKATAVRMYDLVREAWQAELQRVEAALANTYTVGHEQLNNRRLILMTTDMAVIVSPGQNEIEQMKAMGLDIIPHRNRSAMSASTSAKMSWRYSIY